VGSGAPRPRPRLEAALAEQLAQAGQIEEARALAAGALAAAADDPIVLAGWCAIAEGTGQYAEALRAAARMAELGAPTPPERLVRLALGAQERQALARVAAGLPEDHPLRGPLRAFEAGTAADEELVRLGAIAPDEAARRFVARASSPPAPPDGNLFALLEFARDLAARTPALAPLVPAAAHAAEAFDRPLLVAVMGEFNAGKSSFVNAFCGAEVAPVGVTPTTATINVLRYGPPGGRVLYHDGRAEDLTAAAVPVFLGGLGDAEAAAVRMVEIFFPLEVLRRVEIVDTPGLNSLRPEHERVARAFLTDADAIVWLFAVGQAAKASERDALGLAHEAGKRVLGVLNKADQADPPELESLLGYVRGAMSDRIEALLPLSARDAIRGRARGDEALLGRSGLPALLDALEQRFFHEARALKKRTALSALARFGTEARALLRPEPAAARESFARGREQLAARRLDIDGALAAERVRLRAALEQAFRQAAAEVLEFVRPRRWPFGERRAEAADEEFLFDLLEDAVAQATEAARARLEAAAAGGPPLPIAAEVERFRAYARGVLAGGLVARFLHEELPSAGGRVELATLQRALAGRVPDVDGELIVPLAAEIEAAHADARAALEADEQRAGMRRLLQEERVGRPLDALAAAVSALANAP
jgi:GTP-binding protein EngB required for normal cell division